MLLSLTPDIPDLLPFVIRVTVSLPNKPLSFNAYYIRIKACDIKTKTNLRQS